MYLPGSAVDLLQHADADSGTPVAVSAVLALDGPDPADRVDGTYVTGVVARTTELLGFATVAAHQVPYGELERTMVQGIYLGDTQTQSLSAYARPLGPPADLLVPEDTTAASKHARQGKNPPVREQPLHGGDDQADRDDPGYRQCCSLVLLPGTTGRAAPVSTPHRTAAAHRSAPGCTGAVEVERYAGGVLASPSNVMPPSEASQTRSGPMPAIVSWRPEPG
ncbi:hypothetical protein BG418_16095 [Streptomyces sp. CBMA152]|nr:hypothetical protein [Streptomyces sp. CBMA152]